MKKTNTSPISGMQELLPGAQNSFDKYKAVVQDVFKLHGFLHIETPVIERTDILLAKAGGDTEKQIYRVFKTAETVKDSDQALRFDHTVPLARYVVEHENDLKFPFKVTQIGRNFRGERAQKGRFREFYQCDVDVIGRGELPIYYDADVISTLLDTFRGFNLNTPVIARISNRKILSGLIKAVNLEEKEKDIYSIIDHSEKVPEEKTVEALKEIGLEEERVELLLRFMEIHGNGKSVIEDLKNLEIANEEFEEGIKELGEVIRLLEADDYRNEARADMKIVRGLDYYTGTVFEFNLPKYAHVGSVCGGGRYENLAGYFTDQKLPGVGGSIGLTRLYYVLRENGLTQDSNEKPIDYAIVPISEREIDYAMKVAKELRDKGAAVTVVASGKKLGDKLKYAAAIAKNGIVLGDAEIETGKYRVKEFV